MVKITGSKNTVINNGCNTGVICGVNSSTIINGNNNYVSCSSTSNEPYTRCKCIIAPECRIFHWKGKNYRDTAFLNEGKVSKGLDAIQSAWDSHCFGDFLESLRKFDDLMESLTKGKVKLVEESHNIAREVAVFLGKVFENFEGIYVDYIPYAYGKSLFVDYTINDKKLNSSWIVGYDTSILEDEEIFKHGILQFKDGDLHKVYDELDNWYSHLHSVVKELSKEKEVYKAIDTKSFTIKNIVLTEIISNLNHKKKYK